MREITEMRKMRDHSTRRRLTWVAGVTLVVSCAAGVAASTKWIPSLIGAPDAVVALPEIASEVAPQSAVEAALRLMRASRARCSDCGVIESTREMGKLREAGGQPECAARIPENSDLAILLDWHMLARNGYGLVHRTLRCAPQAVKAVAILAEASNGYEILVRFRDGSSQILTEASLSSWRRGDRVKIVAAVAD
jgi:hypothetical protein